MLWLNWDINKLGEMKKEYSKIYEMFKTLNPDFRVKINEDETFSSTFDTPTIDSNNSAVNNTQTNTSNKIINKTSIVDDNVLTVGELKTAIDILTKSKNKDEAIAKAKAVGVDVSKLMVGLIPVVGNVISTGIDIGGIFKKLFEPKKSVNNKEPNDFMKLLSIDDELSVLLDDNIEYAFVKYATNLVGSMSDTDPLPDFFEKLKEFIKEKYSTLYNLTKN